MFFWAFSLYLSLRVLCVVVYSIAFFGLWGFNIGGLGLAALYGAYLGWVCVVWQV